MWRPLLRPYTEEKFDCIIQSRSPKRPMRSVDYKKSQKFHEMKPLGTPSTLISPSDVLASTPLSRDLSSINDSPKVTQRDNYNTSQHESQKQTKIPLCSPRFKARNATSCLSPPVRKGAHFNFSSESPKLSIGGAALSFVGGLGSAVQNGFLFIYALDLCHGDEYHYNNSSPSMRRKGSNLTLDMTAEDLQYDLKQINRIISWNTLSPSQTRNTNDNNESPRLVDDDDGNQISVNVLKANQSRKEGVNKLSRCEAMAKRNSKKIEENNNSSGKTKNKKRKVVKFDYPHISSLKTCPKIRDEDKSTFFFSEGELDQYYIDRRSNRHCTVEVVAIHESDLKKGETEGGKKVILPTFNKSDAQLEDVTIHESNSKSRDIEPGGKSILMAFNKSNDQVEVMNIHESIYTSDNLVPETKENSQIEDTSISTHSKRTLINRIKLFNKNSRMSFSKIDKKLKRKKNIADISSNPSTDIMNGEYVENNKSEDQSMIEIVDSEENIPSSKMEMVLTHSLQTSMD